MLLLEILAYLRPFPGKDVVVVFFFPFVSVSMAVALELILVCCSLGLCFQNYIVLQRGLLQSPNASFSESSEDEGEVLVVHKF